MDKLNLDIPGIKACQQNRHPLLFIDKIVDTTPGEEANSIKCFSYNEWFFPEHYDDDPNAPGFVLIESLVQSFLISFLSDESLRGSRTNFLDVKNATFRRKVIPGDVLTIESELTSLKRGIAKGNSVGYVDLEFACSAEFVVCLPKIMNKYKPK